MNTWEEKGGEMDTKDFFQDYQTERQKNVKLKAEIDALRTALNLAWSSFQEIVLAVKDVQTPNNRIAIAVNNIAVDAQVRIGGQSTQAVSNSEEPCKSK